MNQAEEYLKRYFESEADYLVFALKHTIQREQTEAQHIVSVLGDDGVPVTGEMPSHLIYWVSDQGMWLTWTDKGVECDRQYLDRHGVLKGERA